MSQTTDPRARADAANATGSSGVVMVRVIGWGFALCGAVFCGWMAARYVQQNKQPKNTGDGNAIVYEIDPETGKLRPRGSSAVKQPEWPAEGVRDFSLIDQDGSTVTRADLLGKPWAVCFIFTRCATECPAISSSMRQIVRSLDKYGDEIQFVSLSVDPEYDTPEELKNYAKGYKADPARWRFLTGDQDEIYGLIQKSFLMPVEETTGEDRKPGYEITHSPYILHVNAKGRVVGKYNGLSQTECDQLVHALEAEAEALKVIGEQTDAARSSTNAGSAKRPQRTTSDDDDKKTDEGRSPLGSQLPRLVNFQLSDRSGESITRDDLLGKPWTVNFIFTRCAGPCLQLTAKMADFQKKTRDLEMRMVTITVDPDYDTPDVLRNYADNFGAIADRWLFLTGEKNYVYDLLRGTFRQLVVEMTGKNRRPGYEVLHTNNVLHINADGRIVGSYNGLSDADLLRLEDALRDECAELSNVRDTESTDDSWAQAKSNTMPESSQPLQNGDLASAAIAEKP